VGAATAQKVEGDISSVFVSLSGNERPELPKRFLDLKRKLVAGREKSITASWQRLLQQLRVENQVIAQRRSSIIPQLNFESLDRDLARLRDEIRRRGAAVVKGVVPVSEARRFKDDVEAYVMDNPSTKGTVIPLPFSLFLTRIVGFPAHDPQVFELYWSPSQVRARAHPNLIRTQEALMKIWTSSDPKCPISLSHPITYADRLRIRQPGDGTFTLGPHQDGGSVERWEDDGYGKGRVYDQVFAGRFEDYNAWDVAPRLDAATDLYNAPGNCSAFRMFQGWLSMSWTGPERGTLLVHPNLQLSTSYILLRPFFRQIYTGTTEESLWDPQNWRLASGDEMTSELHGATPGHGQDITLEFHPHLQLDKTMVHIPDIEPGDFVVWHCDGS